MIKVKRNCITNPLVSRDEWLLALIMQFARARALLLSLSAKAFDADFGARVRQATASLAHRNDGLG